MTASHGCEKSLIQFCLSRGWGGLELSALEMAINCRYEGRSCVTICIKNSSLHRALMARELPSYSVKARKYFSPIATLKIRAFLRNYTGGTIVFPHLADLWIAIPALAGSIRDFKLIGISHTLLKVNKKDLFHTWLYKNMSQMICLTGIHKKNLLTNLPISEEKITIIPNAVDLERFHAMKNSAQFRLNWGLCEDEFLVAVIGRLDKKKGQFEAIDCAEILKNKGLKVKMMFIGEDTPNDPGTGEKLKAYVDAKNLKSSVIFTGFQSEIENIVASIDLLLMPSDEETFGRILIEAMASRVPVVATNSGGVPDIITNTVDGLLVSPKNPGEMAYAIQLIMENKTLRYQLVENAYKKVVAHYSFDQIEKQMASVLYQ